MFIIWERAREVRGGIKSRTARGSFAENWWGKRWLEFIENSAQRPKLDKGRSYARRGQVISIELTESGVIAKVQGAYLTPYTVVIKVTKVKKDKIDVLKHELSKDLKDIAALASGGMPVSMESALKAVGVSLFPKDKKDFMTECSCPDNNNPCKHIAAVFYLLAEEIDRDPFILLNLRGVSRDDIMPSASSHSKISRKTQKKKTAIPEHEPEIITSPTVTVPDALSLDAAEFWTGKVFIESHSHVSRPATTAGILTRAGKFPFWRAGKSFMDSFTRVYDKASSVASSVLAFEYPSAGQDGVE